MTRTHRILALAVSALLLTGVGVLLFGPARGARNDLSHLREDLHVSRGGILTAVDVGRSTLTDVTHQLGIAERSLTLQEEGLSLARDSEKTATDAAQATTQILDQTRQTLAEVRSVVAALGPGEQLGHDVRTALTVAQSTLSLAKQTLATGTSALSVARATLVTLQSSLDVQKQQLDVARQTLQQTQEINRKLP